MFEVFGLGFNVLCALMVVDQSGFYKSLIGLAKVLEVRGDIWINSLLNLLFLSNFPFFEFLNSKNDELTWIDLDPFKSMRIGTIIFDFDRNFGEIDKYLNDLMLFRTESIKLKRYESRRINFGCFERRRF